MKILPVSDLHLEFHNDTGIALLNALNKKVDAIVIAGDLSVAEELTFAFDKICKLYKDVIFVNGNHELYNSSPKLFNAIMKECCDKYNNLHWLNNSWKDINGIRFIGGTLWFEDDPKNILYEDRLNDFNVIRQFKPWVYEQNIKALDFFNKKIDNKSVVVTHHLPSYSCVGNIYKSSSLNRFYVSSKAERILIEKEPKLWIHGHSHGSLDMNLGNTRVVRNPFGYAGIELNPNFDTDLVIEVKL